MMLIIGRRVVARMPVPSVTRAKTDLNKVPQSPPSQWRNINWCIHLWLFSGREWVLKIFGTPGWCWTNTQPGEFEGLFLKWNMLQKIGTVRGNCFFVHKAMKHVITLQALGTNWQGFILRLAINLIMNSWKRILTPDMRASLYIHMSEGLQLHVLSPGPTSVNLNSGGIAYDLLYLFTSSWSSILLA